jgi:hypothetical protein
LPLDMLPALEERDQKIVNNPMEAHIIAEVCHLVFTIWHIFL